MTIDLNGQTPRTQPEHNRSLLKSLLRISFDSCKRPRLAANHEWFVTIATAMIPYQFLFFAQTIHFFTSKRPSQ